MKRCDKCFPQGFTLLEVLVALAIMGVAITLVIQLFSSNLRSLAVSSEAVLATIKAHSRLREILNDPKITESSWQEARESGYPMEISLSEVLRERTDNLPVKLFEVALTIHWQEGRKDKKLTLRTIKMADKMGPG